MGQVSVKGDTNPGQARNTKDLAHAGANAGFFGTTPVARVVVNPALTDSTGGAVGTTLPAVPAGGTGTAAGGWDTAGNRDTAITAINDNIATLNDQMELVRSALVAYGLIV